MRIILTISLIIVVAMLISPAVAQTPASSTVLPGCTVEANKANAGGTRIDCKGSEWLGGVDYQCGVYVPDQPNKLNCNLGAGNHINRGYVVLSPDVGKGTLLEDGYKHKLVLVRANRHGGTEFRIKPRFKRSLILCNSHGKRCFDLYKRLR